MRTGTALAEIDRTNVHRLGIAWTYRTGEIERRGPALSDKQSFESTPILVDGMLVLCTPFGRLVALDPVRGAERWTFEPNERIEPRDAVLPKCRGVATWLDPAAEPSKPCRRRIIYGTWDFRVFAVDARTGRRCAGFGRNGEVAISPGKKLIQRGEMQFSTPPAIIGDLAIFGSTIMDGLRADGPSGKVRALDARTTERGIDGILSPLRMRGAVRREPTPRLTRSGCRLPWRDRRRGCGASRREDRAGTAPPLRR